MIRGFFVEPQDGLSARETQAAGEDDIHALRVAAFNTLES